jgi:hypothetical protein
MRKRSEKPMLWAGYILHARRPIAIDVNRLAAPA